MTSRLTGAAVALAMADSMTETSGAVAEASRAEEIIDKRGMSADEVAAAMVDEAMVEAAMVVEADSTAEEVPLMEAASMLAKGRAGGCSTSSLGV